MTLYCGNFALLFLQFDNFIITILQKPGFSPFFHVLVLYYAEQNLMHESYLLYKPRIATQELFLNTLQY